MINLKTLVAMQLRDKLDFSSMRTVKGIVLKIVTTILKYALIIGVIYGGFYLLSGLRLVSLLPGIPQSVMNVLFTVMILLSALVATLSVTNSMYFAKDNALLLTLPVSRTTVFTSKLVVFYIYELIRNSTYMLPLFVAYGMINGMAWWYYIWLIPAFFVVTAVPVAVGALLSIPFMLVSKFVRQHKVLQTSIMVVAIALGIYLVVIAINALPTDLNLVGTWGTTFWQLQTWLTNFSYNFAIFVFMLKGVIGNRYGVAVTVFSSTQLLSILAMIGGVAVVLGITYLLVRPLFFYMASTPFEYKKSVVKHAHSNKCHSPVYSALIKNTKLILRDSGQISYVLYVAVGMPIAILLLNKIFDAIDMNSKGVYMALAFNVLIVLLLGMSTNIDMAHVYSREGASAYINKTIPGSYMAVLCTKLVFNFVITTVGMVVSIAIFANDRAIAVDDALLIWVMVQCTYIAHMLISASSDIMNPQYHQYATTGGHVSNPNDVRSGIMAYVMAVAVAGVSYFLLIENSHVAWVKLAIATACTMALCIWLFVNKIRLYYKEL